MEESGFGERGEYERVGVERVNRGGNEKEGREG